MAGVKRGYWRCAVRLLDGAVVNYDISQKADGRVLLESVMKDLDICEKEYFSLRLPDNQGGKWLELDKALKKQIRVFPTSGCIKINYCIRFYPPEPSYMQEEISRYQLFLQVRRDILETRLEVPFRLAAELFALCLQAELGDFEQLPKQNGYAEEFHFSATQTLEMDQLAEDYHRSGFCSGLTPAEAEHCFIDKVRLLNMYGADIFNAEGMNRLKLRLALTPRGIVALREDARDDVFAWPKITKISWKKRKLMIHLFSQDEDYSREVTASYILPTVDDCKYLWQCCMDSHAFYTQMLGSGHIVPPISRGLFRRSFRRRASGQLEWLKDRDSRRTRSPPAFERSSSVRFTRPNEFGHAFRRSASVRVVNDAAAPGSSSRQGSASQSRNASRCHSVASERPLGPVPQPAPAREALRSSSGDRPRMSSASSTSDVATSRSRVLTTYNAARYRRGSSMSLSSAPGSPPPATPMSPVFRSNTISSSPANSSMQTLDASATPLACSTPEERRQHYKAEQEKAVREAARNLYSNKKQDTVDGPSSSEKTQATHAPLTRSRGRRNQPMAVVHPSRKLPATLTTEPSPPLKDEVKGISSNVVTTVAPLIMSLSEQQDGAQTDGLFRQRMSPTSKGSRPPSNNSITKRPLSTSDASYSEGSDVECKVLPDSDDAPPAYHSECGDSEGELRRPTDDAYSKALREIWVQQDLPPPPPHLLTLVSKAERESRETLSSCQPDETPSPTTSQPSASPYRSAYEPYASRRGPVSPLKATYQPVPENGVKKRQKASSLPHGSDPREKGLFKQTGSLPPDVKGWKSSQVASLANEHLSDLSPVQSRQPVEVTRLVTRARASSRSSFSSIDSSEDVNASPKHRRSVVSLNAVPRSVSFQLGSMESLQSRRAATTPGGGPPGGLGLSLSAEDLFAEMQESLDNEMKGLAHTGVESGPQRKVSCESYFGQTPIPSMSNSAFLSPTSSASDLSPPGARQEESSTGSDSVRKQHLQEDIEMVASIKKRFLQGGTAAAKPPATAPKVTPKTTNTNNREMPTASHPYVLSETPPPPSFPPKIPSPLRKHLSADQLRTVQFADTIMAKRTVARSSMRRSVKPQLSANELET